MHTCHGRTYDLFKDACEARGLLENNAEWDLCLREASEWQLAPSLRQRFATILLYAHPGRPEILGDKHKEALSDEFAFKERQARQVLNPWNRRPPPPSLSCFWYALQQGSGR